MKFIALVLSLVALAAIGYCIGETADNYSSARSDYIFGGSSMYGNSSMSMIDEMRYYDYRETMQTEILVTAGAGLLGLILGFIARRRDGGVFALLAILFALASFGGAGYVLAEYNPF